MMLLTSWWGLMLLGVMILLVPSPEKVHALSYWTAACDSK